MTFSIPTVSTYRPPFCPNALRFLCALLHLNIAQGLAKGLFLAAFFLSPIELMAQEPAPVSFREKVAPLLQEHCLACHCAKRAEGGYRLDSLEQLLKPGDSGDEPIQAADRKNGELLARIVSTDPSTRMPADSEPLKKEELDLIQAWFSQGAPVDSSESKEPLWSLIPPKTYAPPPAKYPHSQPITALCFDESNQRLVASGYHEAIEWSLADKSIARRLQNQPERISSMKALRDPARYILGGGTAGRLGEMRLAMAETGAMERVLARGPEIILDMALRPNSTEVAIAFADSSIRIVDVASGETKRTLNSHADWVTQLAFSDDGSKLGSASNDKSCKIYDMQTGELLMSYAGHDAAVRGIACIGNGDEWISVGTDNRWHRWKRDGGARVALVPLGGEPGKLLLADTFAIVFAADQHWYQLNLENNQLVRKVPAGHYLSSSAFHAATKTLAFGSMDGFLSLWNLADGAKVAEWNGNP